MLSEKQRAHIQILHDKGWTHRAIAKEVQVSMDSVDRWAMRLGLHDNHRSGAPTVLTPDQREWLIAQVEAKTRRSTRFLSREFSKLGTRVSPRTVVRVLKSEGLKPYHRRKRPHIKAVQASARGVFCKKYKSLDWRRIVFADEKSFSAYTVLNSKNDIVWARRIEDVPFRETEKYPAHVKAIITMSSRRLGKPFFYTGKLNAAMYVKALQQSGLVEHPKTFVHGGNVFLMHDGDTGHTGQLTQNFLTQQGIQYVPKEDWPANSPDLNVIENLLSWLAVEVDRADPRTSQQLRTAVLNAHTRVPRSLLKALCESFPERLKLIAKAKGSYTLKY